MSNFKVIWQVDQEAETPAAAALAVAREYFQERIARGLVGSSCCFDVIEEGANLPPFVVDLSEADQGLTGPELQEMYGMEGHPRYHWTYWRSEVGEQQTVLGYWDWVQHAIDAQSRREESRDGR